MATQVQWRRGTAAETAAFTGVVGEITVDTTDNRGVVHDGVTAGGFPMAKEGEVGGKLNGSFYTDSGAANSYVLTLTGETLVQTAYLDGMPFNFVPDNNNTGASVVDVDSIGSDDIKLNGGVTNPSENDIVSGVECQLVYRTSPSTYFELMNPQTPQRALYATGYIDGLITSNNVTDADHDIDIAVGSCIDSTGIENIDLSAGLIKQIDAAWAVGTNQGGLDTGSVAIDTWYHLFVIKRIDTAVADVLFSLSPTSPTLPTNYTVFRRIASVLTDGSGNILAYSQLGDHFTLLSPILDANAANPGTSAVTPTLSTPLGIITTSITSVRFTDTSPVVGTALYITEIVQDDLVPTFSSPGSFSLSTGASAQTTAGMFFINTDTSSLIRYRLSSSTAGHSVQILTSGWLDQRGKA